MLRSYALNFCWMLFKSGNATSEDVPLKTQEFLNKATGFQKGAVESVVIISDGLDNLRVSICEVSM